MIKGLNHITLAVADLTRSFDFYSDLLGFTAQAKWARGAYLSAGDLWLCLTLDATARRTALPEYTHIALNIDQCDFALWDNKLRDAGVELWKQNSSEGDSVYFLDPDGHKLEIHVGDIESRLSALRQQPYQDLIIFPRTPPTQQPKSNGQ